MTEASILRLFISQAFLCYFMLILIPIKAPRRKNTLIIVFTVILITSFNAFFIAHFGMMSFYVRFYFVTLTLPYILLFSYYAIHKGAKLFFAILSVQVFGNVAIINGLLSSYLIYGQDNPLTDSLARVLTFLIFLPLIYKFIGPQYLRMAQMIHKGWWILNFLLVISYILTYYILFVPNAIFHRPEYFVHAYIVIILSLLIYEVIFFLFIEIQSKVYAERDKQLLSIQIGSLSAQSTAISESEKKMNILRHDLRHHLHIIDEQINTGNIQQASLFLQNLEKQLVETTHHVYCRNKVINAALSYYLNIATQDHIKIDAQLDISETLAINPAELAIVFANAVENAIHACLKIEDISLRKIILLSRYVKGNLMIEISNPSYEHVKFDSYGIPISFKDNHGTGVLSMLAFAKKNNAILEFSKDNNIFYMRLLIQTI